MANKISYAKTFYALSAYVVVGLASSFWSSSLEIHQYNSHAITFIYLSFYTAVFTSVLCLFFERILLLRIINLLSVAAITYYTIVDHKIYWTLLYLLLTLGLTISPSIPKRIFVKQYSPLLGGIILILGVGSSVFWGTSNLALFFLLPMIFILPWNE